MRPTVSSHRRRLCVLCLTKYIASVASNCFSDILEDMATAQGLTIYTLDLERLMRLVSASQAEVSELVTIADGARLAGITWDALARRCKRGTQEYWEIGGQRFVRRSDCVKRQGGRPRDPSRRWQGGPYATAPRGLPPKATGPQPETGPPQTGPPAPTPNPVDSLHPTGPQSAPAGPVPGEDGEA